MKSCSLEKKIKFWAWCFWLMTSEWGMYCSLFDDVIDQSNEPMLWLKVYWILGYNTSF